LHQKSLKALFHTPLQLLIHFWIIEFKFTHDITNYSVETFEKNVFTKTENEIYTTYSLFLVFHLIEP